MCGFGVIIRVHPPAVRSRKADLLAAQPQPPTAGESIPDAWLDILDEEVEHRGPDGVGRFRDRTVLDDGTILDVAMVHRRLSILDHEGGPQPMVSDAPAGSPRDEVSRRVAVVFNGCIYNHRELRAKLAEAGAEFTTDHSDTEVLIHGHRAWGSRLPAELEGMFAAAIWDAEAATLSLHRDRFGEKPLYFVRALDHQIFAVSSSALGLFRLVSAIQGKPRELDPNALIEWVAMGYHAEVTPFAGIVQLPPGGSLILPTTKAINLDKIFKKGTAKSPKQQRRPLPALSTKRRLIQKFDELIGDAVAARLEADVPVACFLSGGVDSSVIASHAARRLESLGGKRLTTICVRMPDARYDESAFAQVAADAIGSEHLTIDAELAPADDLVLLIHTLGLPLGDSSLLPTFWAAKAAARHAGVVLTGDGGDELFLGYERYRAADYLWVGQVGVGTIVEKLLSKDDPKARSTKLARLISAGRHAGYRDLLAIFPTPDRDRLLGVRKPMIPKRSTDNTRTLAKAQAYDFRYHMPGDLLRKVDSATMLAGIEARAPLLDSTLASAVMRLPVATLRMKRQRKGMLRAIARRHVPADIVDRPKMGFAVPIGEWFRDDFGGMKQLLHDHLRSTVPFPGIDLRLDFDFIGRLLDEHDRGDRDHSQRLYGLLVLSIWSRWIDALGAEVEAEPIDQQ